MAKIKKVFKWIGKQFVNLGKMIISRTFLFLYLVFSWVFPIYMIGEKVALVKERDAGWKLTFIGIIVALVVVLALYKKIRGWLYNCKPQKKWQFAFQIIGIMLHKAIVLTLVYFFIYYLVAFSGNLKVWYDTAVISLGIGAVCYGIDRTIMFLKGARKNERQN